MFELTHKCIRKCHFHPCLPAHRRGRGQSWVDPGFHYLWHSIIKTVELTIYNYSSYSSETGTGSCSPPCLFTDAVSALWLVKCRSHYGEIVVVVVRNQLRKENTSNLVVVLLLFLFHCLTWANRGGQEHQSSLPFHSLSLSTKEPFTHSFCLLISRLNEGGHWHTPTHTHTQTHLT